MTAAVVAGSVRWLSLRPLWVDVAADHRGDMSNPECRARPVAAESGTILAGVLLAAVTLAPSAVTVVLALAALMFVATLVLVPLLGDGGAGGPDPVRAALRAAVLTLVVFGVPVSAASVLGPSSVVLVGAAIAAGTITVLGRWTGRSGGRPRPHR
ncbi:hypothetical protein AD006_19670 [Pseudonocardia sp. EC080610-09]|nr:hypothetical protein FRP1_11285 [Pseudonocardia sp. EC080625-04]ALL76975.1 hypothetical protein AD006_19670 [Pseudonocardia sp. EC080610-09]ALL84006.1 hypothetical protein AD017_27510 [Pseudonocardia sp. EC080619-01]